MISINTGTILFEFNEMRANIMKELRCVAYVKLLRSQLGLGSQQLVLGCWGLSRAAHLLNVSRCHTCPLTQPAALAALHRLQRL